MVWSLRVLSSPLSDSTLVVIDTTYVIEIVEPICDWEYRQQQREMEFFLQEIMKAFDIEMPESMLDSLNNK